MNAFVTVLGKDCAGIIYEVSKILKENDISVLDINQTLMKERFTMIMLVSMKGSSVDLDTLQSEFDELSSRLDIKIIVQAEKLVETTFEV